MRRDRRSGGLGFGLGRLVAAASAAAVVAAACTGTSARQAAPRPSLPFQGTLLLAPGQSSGGLASYDPASRRLTPIRAIPSTSFDFIAGAVWTGSGTGYFMGQAGRASGLYHVEGSRATRVGPKNFGSLVGVADGTVVASQCFPPRPSLAVLDLADPTKWRSLGKVCGSALSPDGSLVAVTVPKVQGQSIFGGNEFSLGTRVWAQALRAGAPRRLLLAVTAVPALRRVMVADPQVVGLAWGRPGLAVAVANGQSGPWAIVLVPMPASGSDAPSGPPRVVPLGQAQPFDLAWQPNGELLAFTGCYQCTTFGRTPAHVSDIRLYDTKTGSLRQIAGSNNFLTGLVWSPGGDILVTETPDSDLLFVDAGGRVQVRRSINAVPEAWNR